MHRRTGLVGQEPRRSRLSVPTFHAGESEAWYAQAVTLDRTARLSLDSFSVRMASGFETSPLTFALFPGESLALVGPVSCGKSLVFEALAGIVRPEMRTLGMRMGRAELVPQDARLAALPTDNVWSILGLKRRSLMRRRIFGHRLTQSEDEARAEELLARLGLKFSKIFDRPVAGLSHGECKRVLCVAALLKRPETLLIDGWEEYADPGLRKPLLHILDEERARGLCLVLSARHAPLLDVSTQRTFLLSGKSAESELALPLLGMTLSSLDRQDLLRVKGLVIEKRSQKWWGLSHHARLVDRVSFTIKRGECLCILGPSGCGKTNLLHGISGLVGPSAGHVKLAEHDVTSPRGRRARKLRRQVQLVFQEASAALDPQRSVRGHLQEAARVSQKKQLDAKTCLTRVGLPEFLLDAPADQLSTGESQRLDLSRSLAVRPQVVLWDAPECGAADTDGGVLSALLRQEKAAGLAFVVATQSAEVATALADRVAFMYAGRVIETGLSHEVLEMPSHPATHAYLAGDVLGAPDPWTLGVGCPYVAQCPRQQPVCKEETPPLFHITRLTQSGRGISLNHQAACFFPLGAQIVAPGSTPPSVGPGV